MKSFPKKLDYHLHSSHSFDGIQSIYEACHQAVSLGLDEICFTEHIDLYHTNSEVAQIPIFSKWLTDIESAISKYPSLTIRKGLEIGDLAPHREEIYALLKALPLDFHLLSLHLVDGLDPFDSEYFEGKTQQEAYERYLALKLESAKNFDETLFDSYAHLGYVGKFAPYPKKARPLSYHHGPELIDEILKTLIEKEKALEINASGLRNTSSPIPSQSIIKRYLDLGGEFFTFSSDAHKVEDIYGHVAEAKEIAISLGAKWELSFKNRQKSLVPLF